MEKDMLVSEAIHNIIEWLKLNGKEVGVEHQLGNEKATKLIEAYAFFYEAPDKVAQVILEETYKEYLKSKRDPDF